MERVLETITPENLASSIVVIEKGKNPPQTSSALKVTP
jgi:hypothetical protein